MILRAFAVLVGLWLLAAVVSVAAGPPLLVYALIGWRWAIIAGIAWVGVLGFAAYLLPRALAGGIAGSIMANIDGAMLELQWEEQKSNHARFEGTWTPHEVALDVAGRKLAAYELAEMNHATAEGAYLRPPLHATEL